MTLFSLWRVTTAVMLSAFTFTASAQECKSQERQAPLNLTIPLTVQMPDKAGAASVGTILYKKEMSLAQLSGSHHEISGACAAEMKRFLSGRMNSPQSGNNIFSTALPGIGLRITLISNKPGTPRKEWVFPFTASLSEVSQTPFTTDDIKFRLELVKTGIIQGGTLTLRLPSMVTLNDSSLVVNLAMTVLSAKAHCSFLVNQPQIDLPPINIKELARNVNNKSYPVDVNLQCMNTSKAGINIEGATDPQVISVFKNVAPDNAASGVGIEMLYNGSVMTPFHPLDISLPGQQLSINVPLAVRYAKTNDALSEGKVKAQITLRINYL